MIAARSNPAFADSLNGSLSHFYRRTLAAVSEIFPFSLFEALIISIPLLVALVIILAVRAFRRGRAVRFLVNLASFALLVYSAFAISMGVAYNATPLQKKMGMEEAEINAEVLAEIMTSLRDEANSLVPYVNYVDGASVSGYTDRELSEVILRSYDKNRELLGIKSFPSTAKQIHFGNVMSYFGITGIYTFYTGEANVNSAYPDFDIAFTSAHELAHQRGILRENEANFTAYLVCSTSDDPYLRYSAALYMYQYIGSALYRTDKELYGAINSGLSEACRGDIRASYEVSRKYGDTVIADISNFFNDLYLKGNGTEGVVSYGRVVEMTVSYFEYLKNRK